MKLMTVKDLERDIKKFVGDMFNPPDGKGEIEEIENIFIQFKQSWLNYADELNLCFKNANTYLAAIQTDVINNHTKSLQIKEMLGIKED